MVPMQRVLKYHLLLKVRWAGAVRAHRAQGVRWGPRTGQADRRSSREHCQKLYNRDFPGGPWLRLFLPVQGPGGLILVGELRAHVLKGQQKKL